MSSIWKNVALGIGAVGASVVSAVVAAKAADKASDYREKQRREKLDEEFDQLRKKTNPTSTEALGHQPTPDPVFKKIVVNELNNTLKRYQQDRNNDCSRFPNSDSNSYDDNLQRKVFEEGKQKDGQTSKNETG